MAWSPLKSLRGLLSELDRLVDVEGSVDDVAAVDDVQVAGLGSDRRQVLRVVFRGEGEHIPGAGNFEGGDVARFQVWIHFEQGCGEFRLDLGIAFGEVFLVVTRDVFRQVDQMVALEVRWVDQRGPWWTSSPAEADAAHIRV